MHLLIIDKNNIHELRHFALTMSIAFPVVFMAILPWIFGFGIPLWPVFLSAILLVMYVMAPKLLHYPQIAWAWISFVLGWVNTRILLWIVFYVLIFPMGFIARHAGKLNYNAYENTTEEMSQQSFWVKRESKAAKQDLENPF